MIFLMGEWLNAGCGYESKVSQHAKEYAKYAELKFKQAEHVKAHLELIMP
jgi:hypothetical protein